VGHIFPVGHVKIEVCIRRIKHVNQTCHYRSALRDIDDIYFTVPIGAYKEAEANCAAQTRDSIIPDTVNREL